MNPLIKEFTVIKDTAFYIFHFKLIYKSTLLINASYKCLNLNALKAFIVRKIFKYNH